MLSKPVVDYQIWQPNEMGRQMNKCDVVVEGCIPLQPVVVPGLLFHSIMIWQIKNLGPTLFSSFFWRDFFRLLIKKNTKKEDKTTKHVFCLSNPAICYSMTMTTNYDYNQSLLSTEPNVLVNFNQSPVNQPNPATDSSWMFAAFRSETIRCSLLQNKFSIWLIIQKLNC